MADRWDLLQKNIVRCDRCPRLRDHCARVAAEKRAAYRDWDYWGGPVSNFGDPDARLLIVGLAPGAHGANRTGRMFTGDRSGDFLYDALHQVGFANQATCIDREDGLTLNDVVITAAAHCAPPGNKPTREELQACFGHLVETVRQMPRLRGLLALGGIAFNVCLKLFEAEGWAELRPKPKFAHGTIYEWKNSPFLIGSYHPSQQNTFTGRLTMPMLVKVFQQARIRL
ncbi:MAG: uracil-DNA glycosylase [Phycisphaera sp.]|nr:uracil-DNA glycosylase [Phycisphaera sp.]